MEYIKGRNLNTKVKPKDKYEKKRRLKRKDVD